MFEPPKQERLVLKNLNLDGWRHEKHTEAVWNMQTISTFEYKVKKIKLSL
jgi:hypothetical protein